MLPFNCTQPSELLKCVVRDLVGVMERERARKSLYFNFIAFVLTFYYSLIIFCFLLKWKDFLKHSMGISKKQMNESNWKNIKIFFLSLPLSLLLFNLPIRIATLNIREVKYFTFTMLHRALKHCNHYRKSNDWRKTLLLNKR